MASWRGLLKLSGGLVAAAGAATAVMVLRDRWTEQPNYRLIDREGAIEVRDYPTMLAAETRVAGEREAALGLGFRRLADFIFAKRRGDASADEKIAMTAPVLADRYAATWRTRFIMPSFYTDETLPRPGGDVSIAEIPARRIAAIRFAGATDDATLAARERTLHDWLVAASHTPDGPAEHAYYNSPFVPPPLRRNEIWVPIRS